MFMSDDYIFKFFKYEIDKLQELGSVYYSENFKIIKKITSRSIKGNITSGKYDYFKLDFKIDGISDYEIKNILKAFRDNLKYFKLENGEFLDLEEIELTNFLKLIDISADDVNLESCYFNFHKSKAPFIDYYLEENKIRYIKGKKELSTIKDKFKKINSSKFDVPNLHSAELREYQKIGYNWLKTLDYLGFGGILGDEMGLGKTIQMIAFLLSNKFSKSLIIAPTSLIYNWAKEIETFAPSIKFNVVSGNKEERESVIQNLENYDVIITTYNLLKRDIELYKEINFNYCILDEAQYIKNHTSQNAISAKMINANVRFALTGTPLENSLMDLWSIFDFIMPGYLYDDKRFSVRYHKKLKESPEVISELNQLTKPFILRRYKKGVIKELPCKIEKQLIVSMSKEQEKIYSIYNEYVKDLISKKIKDDEFIKSKIEILSYITKLRQICLDTSVVYNDFNGESGKVLALIELLHQSIEEGHKILVFSQFTSILKNIANKLQYEDISYNYLDGSISSEKRMQLVNEFNNGNTPVFLISLKTGGTGLNLTSADVVIHFDPWWNPAVEDQATDRAHRFGQKNVVEVIKLIAKGSIEEKIVELQSEKRKLIDKVIDNEENFKLINELKEDELLKLFDF
ncbi:hypothetical protein JCM1393_27150 [Clostridium carnis]